MGQRRRVRRLGTSLLAITLVGGGAYLLAGRDTGRRFTGGASGRSTDGASLQRFQQRLRPGALTGWNFLFITWDTVRADHIGCYGYAAAETPTLDGLAGRGVQFDHAVTGVPSTLPTHCTMLTGLEAPRHGVRTNGKFNLGQEHVTLAEVLRQQGYATAAFVATFVLHRRFGLDQGFDHYDDAIPKEGRRADHVTDAAVQWLEGHLASRPAQPFFIWVHYFDAHRQDHPPPPFSERFADRPYDGHIAFVDSQMRRLLDFVKSKQQTERTLIMVTSDHGEGLGDHLEPTHSRLIYDSTMRIPLVISLPAFYDAPGRVGDVTVGTIDLMPTVLSLLGVEPAVAMDGLDLVTASVPKDRAIYLETLAPFLYHGWAPLHGIRRIDAKYIAAPLPEYYDLANDPGERSNLLEVDPGANAGLAAVLEARMANWPSAGEAAALATSPDPRMVQQLAALGYVSTTSIDALDSAGLPDPKDMLPIWRELGRNDPVELHRLSVELLQQVDADQAAIRRAAILAEAACAAQPDNAEFLRVLGTAQYRAGRSEEAVHALSRFQRLTAEAGDPIPPDVATMLAEATSRLDATD